MINVKFVIPAFVLMIFLIVGCSSPEPVSNGPGIPSEKSQQFDPVMVSDIDSSGNPTGGSGLLGVFQGMIDPKTLLGNLSPVRFSSSQDVLEVVDITNFLLLAPCNNCVELKDISLDSESNLVLTIGIKHPFSKADLSQPPTGKNRADLHVFNVEGIVDIIADPLQAIAFSTSGQIAFPITLVNADGYTPYLDQSLDAIKSSTASIHPYILHFDDFSAGNFSASNPYGFADITNPSGYLVMPQGSPMDYKKYVFKLDNLSSPFEFLYAVGCTYGVSAEKRSLRLTPEYKLPQFNKKAATKVWLSGITEMPPSGLQGGITTSTEILEFSVLDMNYGISTGTDKDKMMHTSDISLISIEIPSVLSGAMIFNAPAPNSGDPRNPDNPLKYQFLINNELGAPEGTYTGLIKIVDSYPTGSNMAIAGDGIKRVGPAEGPLTGLFSIPEFATYSLFNIDVAFSNNAPSACFNFTPDNFNPPENLPVQFDASCSDDPDGSVILYEWDFDYDGVTFTTDDTGIEVSHAYPVSGDYTIALQVTDDGNPALSDITTDSITIDHVNQIVFEANELLLNDVVPEKHPVGLHYADSLGDSIYVAVPDIVQNIRCLRSEDGGETFITPAAFVNDLGTSLLESASLHVNKAGHADVAWMVSGATSYIYHDKAYSNYNFQTDTQVAQGLFSIHFAHDVSASNKVNVAFGDYSNDNYNFDVVLYMSDNDGINWNTQMFPPGSAINIADSCGDDSGLQQVVVTLAADEQDNVHIFYIDHTSRELRYTRCYDNGESFTDYQGLAILNPLPTEPNLLIYKSMSTEVSDNGEDVYIVYRSYVSSYGNIYCMASHDGGITFSSPVPVDDIATRNCDKCCLTMDPYGWLYVVYLESISATVRDLRFTYSTDGGASWAPSVKINDDSLPAADQQSPTITVDSNLRVHIFWRDSRNQPGPTPPAEYDLYYARGTWQ
jgi:hypothetical protein